MKLGIVQQIGKPQEVYDDPVNLFVAKFLGTPPINVFTASVKDGKLYIGEEDVMDVSAADGNVVAAIRPEGFVLQKNGRFTCQLQRVEVMGRDITVVCDHKCTENPAVRAIIRAENKVDTSCPTVRFDLNADKVFLFDPNTGARI